MYFIAAGRTSLPAQDAEQEAAILLLKQLQTNRRQINFKCDLVSSFSYADLPAEVKWLHYIMINLHNSRCQEGEISDHKVFP